MKKFIKAFIPHGIVKLKSEYSLKIILNFLRKNIEYFNEIRENSVLLVETRPTHGEVLPSFAKYLLDLGYNVDIVFNNGGKKRWHQSRNDKGLFSAFSREERLRVKPLPPEDINLLLRKPIVMNYKHIILSTFSDSMLKRALYKVDLFRLKPVCVIHNPDVFHDYINTDKKISIAKMELVNRSSPFVVNANYFGEFDKKEKNTKTTFFTLNSRNLDFRNLHLLFSACDKLYETGITDFVVKIVGNGISVPERFSDNFQTLGFLVFEEMYKEILKSDFILSLIDQASIRYTNKASGTSGLSYGFLKPVVLHCKFSAPSEFNDKNSVQYCDNNALATAMERCVNMSKDDYSLMVKELEVSKDELYKRSLKNLKQALEVEI